MNRIDKDSYYFPHDYHARHDPKLERLRMELGAVSDGVFWDLVEMLYEQGGYLSISDVPIFSKTLNTSEEIITKVIKGAFSCKNGKFYNRSLLNRLSHIKKVRQERSIAGRKSAQMRNKCSTIVGHLSNNIKERKGKESKVNKSIVSIPPTIEEVIVYCKERNKNIDPQKWFNHYQAKGWFIGKNKMKDWKAAVRTWERTEDKALDTPKKKPARLQVLEMKALKIESQVIKESLIQEGYPEHEIDEALGRI